MVSGFLSLLIPTLALSHDSILTAIHCQTTSVFGYYRLEIFVFYRASPAFETHLRALQCWEKFNAKALFYTLPCSSTAGPPRRNLSQVESGRITV